MAIRHGLAGQYGKAEATQRHRRILMVTFYVAGGGLVAIGFVAGVFWQRGPWGPVLAVLAMLAVLGFFLLISRPISRFVDRTAKERVKFMRGGQAEALIAWLLEDLDDDWHIFNGVKLEADSDIDHVVVGPRGVFCISTKSQRGLFNGTEDGLLHNGQPRPFAQQVMRQTMDLKDRIGVAMGGDVPWVQPVLALPFGYVEEDACGGKVWVVHQEDILPRLAPEDAPSKLTKDQIARTVKVVEMIKDGAADVYRRPAPVPPTA